MNESDRAKRPENCSDHKPDMQDQHKKVPNKGRTLLLGFVNLNHAQRECLLGWPRPLINYDTHANIQTTDDIRGACRPITNM